MHTRQKSLVWDARLPALLLAAICFLPQLRAQPAAPPVENRYLFIFDTSSAMKKRVPSVQRALNNLLVTSMGGQLRAGDSLGVWTFDRELHAGKVPLQIWDPSQAAETTSQPEYVHSRAALRQHHEFRRAPAAAEPGGAKFRTADGAHFFGRRGCRQMVALRRCHQRNFPAAPGRAQKGGTAVRPDVAFAAGPVCRLHDWVSAGGDGLSGISAPARVRSETGRRRAGECRTGGAENNLAPAGHRRHQRGNPAAAATRISSSAAGHGSGDFQCRGQRQHQSSAGNQT